MPHKTDCFVTATKRVVFGPLTEGFENKRSRGGTPSESVFLPEVKGRNRPAELRPLRNYFLITESDEIEVIPWFSIIVFLKNSRPSVSGKKKLFCPLTEGFFLPAREEKSLFLPGGSRFYFFARSPRASRAGIKEGFSQLKSSTKYRDFVSQ